MFTTKTANIDPETGIRYGVINANSLHGDVLDQMTQEGIDVGMDNAREDLISGLKLAVRDYTRYSAVLEGLLNEIADHAFEDCEGYGPFDFTIDGVTGSYSNDSNIVMIFKSPVKVMARQCSPCYPNAGDLDSLEDGNVETYGVPTDWLRGGA